MVVVVVVDVVPVVVVSVFAGFGFVSDPDQPDLAAVRRVEPRVVEELPVCVVDLALDARRTRAGDPLSSTSV